MGQNVMNMEGVKRSLPYMIRVEPSGWGDCQVKDVQRLLDNVADQLVQHMTELPRGVIHVQCRSIETNPRILYRESPRDDIVIWLTAKDRKWSQYSYQFAHEFCHFISDYERLRLKPNMWFHESVCELASLFVLKQMALTWQSSPPYKHWQNFAKEHDKYADAMLNCAENKLPVGVQLPEWFQEHEASLRHDAFQRQKNFVVAIRLLPIIQSQPTQWQSLRYLPNTDASFRDFLAGWRTACPAKHRDFVTEMATAFRIDIS